MGGAAHLFPVLLEIRELGEGNFPEISYRILEKLGTVGINTGVQIRYQG